MKIAKIVMGVLLLAGGVYCMLTPVSTYASLSVIIGLVMVVEGIAGIVEWFSARKGEAASGWTLAGAILSLVMGIVLLGSYVLQFSVDMFIAYLIAFWLAGIGVVRIVTAIMDRDKSGSEGASHWIIQLVLGILLVVLGFLCVFNPLAVMVGFGFTLGMAIIVVGAELIISAFQE